MSSFLGQETVSAPATNSTQATGNFPGPSPGSKTSSQQPLHVRIVEQSHRQDDGGLFTNGSRSENAYANDLSGPSDDESVNTAFTESTVVPKRNLGFIQVTSLMLNGCLGTGFFFTTPCYVLALVRSKRICLIMWAVGGVYSAIGMLLFLEYGTALPYNGAALIYLDEVFNRPTMLATVIFSFWQILFGSTEGSAKSIATTILSLASNRPASELELGLLNFTSVVVQTVVCLLLFFARRFCFALNTTFALFKVVLFVVIFIAGMAQSGGPESGLKDFNVEYPGYNSKEALMAMIYIILCYQGWDNANYVSGEVKDYKKTLKRAGIATILILTCMNMLATLAFFSVADYATLTNEAGQDNSALQFAQTVFGSTRGMEAATGLSALSSLVFVTYTTAKVKQAIAWQRIIPFSQFFGRQDPEFDSPGGGLVLHWIFTVIPLLSLGNMASDPRIFVSGIYAYGYQIMFGLGIPRLKARMRISKPHWKPTYLKNNVLVWSIAIIFTIWNIVILVMTALPPYSPGTIPRFWWPITLAITVAAACGYWGLLRVFEVTESNQKKALGSRVGFGIRIYEYGDENVPEEMELALLQAGLDGTRRRLQYKLSGPIGLGYSKFHKFKNAVFRFMAW